MKIGLSAAVTPEWPKLDWVEQAAGRLGHACWRAKMAGDLPDTLQWSDLTILGMKSVGGRWVNIRDALQARTCPVAYWWFDLVLTDPDRPLAQQPFMETFGPIFREVDIAFVKERSLLAEYRSLGINAYWLDQGCPEEMPEMPLVVPSARRWDLLIWGQVGHYNERRAAAVAAVKAGFRVAWATNQPVPAGVEQLPWTPAFKLPERAAQARYVLSCGRVNHLEGYWSDQFWMAVGMGAVVLRHQTPGLPEGPYLKYSNHAELLEHLSCTTNDHLGPTARQWVMAEHTVRHRLAEAIALTAAARDTRPSPSLESRDR